MLTLLSGDFSRSLYRLRLKFVQTTRVVSRKYYVLINLSTRTHHRKCAYSLKSLRVLTDVFTCTHKYIYTYILLSKRLCACIEENLPTLVRARVGRLVLGYSRVALRLTDEATHAITHLHLEASISIGRQNK